MAEDKTKTTRSQNPFSTDPMFDETEDEYLARLLRQSKGGFKEDTDTAKDDTDAEYKKVKDTENTDLWPWANANIAKTGGEKGRINNLSYDKTLRLAREADAYNNAPREKAIFFQSGGSGQMGQLSEVDKFEKPKLQTMETRAMDQSFDLDTQQKEADIELQSAIKRKDLDAFIAAWKQKYGIVLDREQASIEMTKLMRQSQMADVVQRYFKKWGDKWQRWINTDTLAAIQDLVATNEIFAAYIGNLMTGGVSPTVDDLQGQEAVRALLKKKFPTWDGKYYGSNIPDIWQKRTEAQRELMTIIAKGTADFEKQVKKW